MNKELGKITSVFFGREDHGIMTFMIQFDFGGSGQGFGGYGLDRFDKEKNRRVGTEGGLDLVMKLLDLFKVDSLDKIVGRTAYAIRDGEKFQSMIRGIEIPPFDGGGKFMMSDWQSEWFPEKGVQ